MIWLLFNSLAFTGILWIEGNERDVHAKDSSAVMTLLCKKKWSKWFNHHLALSTFYTTCPRLFSESEIDTYFIGNCGKTASLEIVFTPFMLLK